MTNGKKLKGTHGTPRRKKVRQTAIEWRENAATNCLEPTGRFVAANDIICDASWDRLSPIQWAVIELYLSHQRHKAARFADRFFSAAEIMKAAGLNSHQGIAYVSAQVSGLLDKKIRFLYKTNKEDGGKVFNWATSYSWKNVYGPIPKHLIAVRLNPELEQYFLKLYGNFTVFQITNTLKLSNHYTRRLYQLLLRWNDQNGIYRRYVIDVDGLRERLGATKKSHATFAEFNRGILKRAIDEIRALKEEVETPDGAKQVTRPFEFLRVEVPKKCGRRFSKLQFVWTDPAIDRKREGKRKGRHAMAKAKINKARHREKEEREQQRSLLLQKAVTIADRNIWRNKRAVEFGDAHPQLTEDLSIIYQDLWEKHNSEQIPRQDHDKKRRKLSSLWGLAQKIADTNRDKQVSKRPRRNAVRVIYDEVAIYEELLMERGLKIGNM